MNKRNAYQKGYNEASKLFAARKGEYDDYQLVTYMQNNPETIEKIDEVFSSTTEVSVELQRIWQAANEGILRYLPREFATAFLPAIQQIEDVQKKFSKLSSWLEDALVEVDPSEEYL